MTSHVVMIPPYTPAGDRAVEAEYVADRFSVWAFVFPVVWALWHRLWLEAAILVLIGLGIGFAVARAGTAPVEVAGGIMTLLISILVGLESASLRVAALRRRGWSEAAIVNADNAEEAAIRFAVSAANVPGTAPASAVPPPAFKPHPKSPADHRPALGLLSIPDGR